MGPPLAAGGSAAAPRVNTDQLPPWGGRSDWTIGGCVKLQGGMGGPLKMDLFKQSVVPLAFETGVVAVGVGIYSVCAAAAAATASTAGLEIFGRSCSRKACEEMWGRETREGDFVLRGAKSFEGEKLFILFLHSFFHSFVHSFKCTY